MHRFWSFILYRGKSDIQGVLTFLPNDMQVHEKELDISLLSLLMSVILISSNWMNNDCVFEGVNWPAGEEAKNHQHKQRADISWLSIEQNFGAAGDSKMHCHLN